MNYSAAVSGNASVKVSHVLTVECILIYIRMFLAYLNGKTTLFN